MCSNSARDSQLSDADKSGGIPGPAYYANVPGDSSDEPRASERGVDLLPDPTSNGRATGSLADSDPGGAVPVPLRITKKRRSTKPSQGIVTQYFMD